MKIKHLGSGIVLIENLLSKEELALVDFNLIESQCIPQGYQNVGEKIFLEGGYEVDPKKDIPNIPTRYMENIYSLPFINLMEEKLYKGIVEYCKLFPVALEAITNCVGKHFIKYFPGNFMGPHSDSSLAYKNGTLEIVSAIALGNTVTASIILNDKFKGGSVIFNTLGIEVHPEAGSALFYPSNYIGSHEVCEILSGIRWAFLAFYSHGDRSFISNPDQEKYAERYEWMTRLREDVKNNFPIKDDNLNFFQKKVSIDNI